MFSYILVSFKALVFKSATVSRIGCGLLDHNVICKDQVIVIGGGLYSSLLLDI